MTCDKIRFHFNSFIKSNITVKYSTLKRIIIDFPSIGTIFVKKTEYVKHRGFICNFKYICDLKNL